MSPARALLFHASADLYGSDQTMIDLVEGLLAAGWRVEVALPHDGPLVSALQACGARLHIGGFSPFGRATLRPTGLFAFPFQLLSSALACCRLMRAVQPDVVHVNTLIIPAPALAARLLGLPLVWHVHEIMTRPAALASGLAKLVGRLSTRVACNSKATLQELKVHSPLIAKKALVISNGVRGISSSLQRELRRELHIPESSFVFLFVGRLNAWKGQELFIEAAARVAKQHPQALFLAAGDAPTGQPQFRESFLGKVEAHGFGDSFQWLGFRADTQALYCAVDASVVPSLLPEPFGLVAAEAMAASLPVIAAGHGGLAEIVEHGVTGLHTEPGDVDSLVKAMEEFLLEPHNAAQMGQAGKRRQEEQFSVARYQERFVGLYAQLLTGV